MLNSRSLDDLRSDVRVNVEILLALCKQNGLQVLITQTKRDNAYQAYLYAQGRTRPGKIVTNSRTTTFHGAGLAFDFCKNVKGHEYDDGDFFKRVGALAKKVGFSWGGDWKTFPDRPHVQWDDGGAFSTGALRSGRTCPVMIKYVMPGSAAGAQTKKEPVPLAKATTGSAKKEEDDDDMRRYQTIAEIRKSASWAADTVQKLIDKKAIQGDSFGRLDLSEDVLRILVINDRMGVYGK